MLSALGVQFGLVSWREVLKVGRFVKVRDFLIRGSPDQFTAEWEGRPPARAALYGTQSIKKIAVSSDYLNRPRLL